MLSSSPQETCTKRIRHILKFALYSFIHNFFVSTTPIMIIDFSSSGKLRCLYLKPLSFPLVADSFLFQSFFNRC